MRPAVGVILATMKKAAPGTTPDAAFSDRIDAKMHALRVNHESHSSRAARI
jgi:hypothetical protein